MSNSPESQARRSAINARTRSLAAAAGLPTVVSSDGRVFAARPEAVFLFIVRSDYHLLLLRRPGSPWWRPVGGAVEADESLEEAVLRESREELGPAVHVTPLGLVHAWSYRYDDGVRWMTDLAWVVAYEGGEVVPGDDMAGCEVGWFLPERVTSLGLTVPEGAEWLLRRVLAVYRLSRT